MSPQAPLSRAWFGIGLTIVLLVLLIIFIAQNTARTNVSFLGLSGALPLAAALLAATLAGAVLAAAIGTTLVAQRRRRARG
jgi:putative membrane protein